MVGTRETTLPKKKGGIRGKSGQVSYNMKGTRGNPIQKKSAASTSGVGSNQRTRLNQGTLEGSRREGADYERGGGEMVPLRR